ncbi:MAG TPA: class I SAM-dependent methyltransferase [Candidatus Aquabacterium excrementipullorum]|nr:class I SAM-dependent methyltransferase [Candidatus Aquabacterium excrementipullorum]
MTDQTIRFEDGASYEQMMGRWSLLVGERFLDWINPPKQASWVDVGCGNGAFTELIVQRCAPSSVHAIDPSEAQLAYARQRLQADAPVTWVQGDALHVPVPDASRDVAVMALVLFFVPDAAKGVAEMCRAVKPGGIVAAYHWDMLNRGFPLAAIGQEMLKIGLTPSMPPSVQASTIEASQALWQQAGLRDVRTTQITVQREFSSFDEYWNSAAGSNMIRSMIDDLPADQKAALKGNVKRRLEAGDGPFTVSARANAVVGIR